MGKEGEPQTKIMQGEQEILLKKKDKKPRTEAQKQALAKGLAVMRERREALKKKEEEEEAQMDEEAKSAKLKAQYEKKYIAKRKLPPVEYVSIADFDRFQKNLFSALENKQVYREVEKIVEKPVPVQVPVAYEKETRTVQQVAVPVPVKEVLSGNALLDRIFFNSK